MGTPEYPEGEQSLGHMCKQCVYNIASFVVYKRFTFKGNCTGRNKKATLGS